MNELLQRITETILDAILGNDEWNERHPYFSPPDITGTDIAPESGHIGLELKNGTLIEISVTVTKGN